MDEAPHPYSPKTGSQHTIGQMNKAFKIAAKAMGQPPEFAPPPLKRWANLVSG